MALMANSHFHVAGLFAGIGGLELGLARAGHHTELLCEIEPGAVAVLRNRFPRVPVHEDVTTLKRLPRAVNLVVAGFPCQDLSQAGLTKGLGGLQSSLVDHVFRLLKVSDVPWVVLENVPFMLQLGLITADSFTLNLALAPLVVAGAWLGRRLVLAIDQRLFENIALGLSLVAGLRLLW